ncbi:NlpC/P60 family protein [Staphylococcus chromogenes]|nr:NlpC/P60 family protein [Staphylococcus chromogenes]
MATLNTSAQRRQRTRSLIAAATACASISTLSTVATPAKAQPIGSSQAPTNPSDEQLAQAAQNIATSSENVSQLALELSRAQAEVTKLENIMGGLREAVNKALVDLQKAQAEAQTAREQANTAKGELDTNQKEIEAAQAALNEISRTAYRQGSANSAVAGAAGTANTSDALARQSYLRLNAEKQRAAIDKLDRLRTESANKESKLREARAAAEAKEGEAKSAESQAQAAVTANVTAMQEQAKKHQDLKTQQVAAQARLDAAKSTSKDLQDKRKEYQDFLKAEEARKEAERRAAEAAAARAKAEAEARARAEAEAQARREAEAAAQAERAEKQRQAEAAKAAAEAAKQKAASEAATADEREQARKDAASAAEKAAGALANAQGPTGNPAVAAAGPVSTIFKASDYLTLEEPEAAAKAVTAAAKAAVVSRNNPVTAVSGSRSEKIEAVIARAQSQIGMPYAWGGGNASGPTKGIRDGGVADSHGDYNKVGFDCSGLTMYAFAAAGISLPHYTGYQYQEGQKIDPSQAQRGDLLFWGPNAEHHVAIYLGNGQMIEAPQSGSTVQISPVRWAGMSPYAVRLL